MKKRYFVIGSTKKGWSVVDCHTAGMPTVEHGIPRKWIAEARCEALNKDWEKKKGTK